MFVTRERANQRSGQDAVSLVRNNSCHKEEVVVHVQQITMVESIFLSLSHCLLDIFATGKHVSHRDKYGLETTTNLQSLHFHGAEKAIKLAEKYNDKDQRNLKRNCKTFSKVKCIQISCKKCLILNMFIIKSSVLEGNVSWDREVSVIKCPLHKGFVMSLSVISSVPEKSGGCREVSTIKDVCCKEVSLLAQETK